VSLFCDGSMKPSVDLISSGPPFFICYIFDSKSIPTLYARRIRISYLSLARMKYNWYESDMPPLKLDFAAVPLKVDFATIPLKVDFATAVP